MESQVSISGASQEEVEPVTRHLHLFQHINLTQGRWDQSRKFKIFEHAYTGLDFDKLSQENKVTLVTQSSLHKLHWLSQVIEF